MDNLEVLQSFGKGKGKLKTGNDKNAIIYIRVSSKEQTENLSLDVQLKGCENFVLKKQLQIKGIFGGTYESAQTDECDEFKRMVAFAKNYRQGISFIIVYSLERFSRTGENAIWLSRQLRELGITIVSVTQPIDTTPQVNPIIKLTHTLSDNFQNKKKGLKENIFYQPALVAPRLLISNPFILNLKEFTLFRVR